MRVDSGLGKAARGIDARGVLEVLAMLSDQGVGQAGQLLAEFSDKLGAHQILYGLLGVGIGVILDLKLVYRLVFKFTLMTGEGQVNIRHTHPPRCRGLPQGF